MSAKKQKGQKRARQTAKRRSKKSGKNTGVSLETAVERLQKMLDPNATVTRNEKLTDRLGNVRQCDVLMRGTFGGSELLGIIECKDHGKKMGPREVSAFAKDTEHLLANVKIMVSRRGFTQQALVVARHEGIGTYSLLAAREDPGFRVGIQWYARAYAWPKAQIIIRYSSVHETLPDFSTDDLKYNGMPVINWLRHRVRHVDWKLTESGWWYWLLKFTKPVVFSVDGTDRELTELIFKAERTVTNKTKMMSVSGDGYIDWGTGQLKVPANGRIVTEVFRSDLSDWDAYEGEIHEKLGPFQACLNAFIVSQDEISPVPDFEGLVEVTLDDYATASCPSPETPSNTSNTSTGESSILDSES